METLIQDIRYGLRTLAKTPGFTAVAVLTLALGIGANTAIFTLIDAVMLKSLPVAAPRELGVVGDPLRVHSRSMGSPQTEIASYPLYRELRDRNQVFTGLLASCEVRRLRVTDARSEDISTDALAVMVSGNYFSVLGTGAVRGRTLAHEDDGAVGAHPVAVVSYSFWKTQMKGDDAIVGQTVRLNNYPFTIVGVTEPSFYGDAVGDRQQIWVPISMQPQMMPGRMWLENPNASWIHMIGRLRPGTDLDRARTNMNVVLQNALKGPFGASMTAEDRENLVTAKIMVSSGSAGFSALRGGSFKSLLVLMGLVVLVMGIACVNVANLLLARASARQREMAVRLALGAGSGRVMRQLLTDADGRRSRAGDGAVGHTRSVAAQQPDRPGGVFRLARAGLHRGGLRPDRNRLRAGPGLATAPGRADLRIENHSEAGGCGARGLELGQRSGGCPGRAFSSGLVCRRIAGSHGTELRQNRSRLQS